jgi:hypothetical protein
MIYHWGQDKFHAEKRRTQKTFFSVPSAPQREINVSNGFFPGCISLPLFNKNVIIRSLRHHLITKTLLHSSPPLKITIAVLQHQFMCKAHQQK